MFVFCFMKICGYIQSFLIRIVSVNVCMRLFQLLQVCTFYKYYDSLIMIKNTPFSEDLILSFLLISFNMTFRITL